MERRAQEAERAAQRALLALFFAKRVGKTYDGRVTGIVRGGLFIQVRPSLAEGFIPLGDLGNERWRVSQVEGAIFGLETGCRIGLGDPMRVRVVRVNQTRQEIDLAPVGLPRRSSQGPIRRPRRTLKRKPGRRVSRKQRRRTR
jgi:ribonuclease R